MRKLKSSMTIDELKYDAEFEKCKDTSLGICSYNLSSIINMYIVPHQDGNDKSADNAVNDTEEE